MRKLIYILTVLSFSFSEAQNLVYDGSFEDTIRCPLELNGYIQSTLKYWKKSGNISGVVMNACNTNKWGVPQNGEGYEYAHSGNGYINVPTFGGVSNMSDFRQFAIGQLKQTLVAGKKYKVTIYVSLADSFIYACNNISIYFSDTIPTYNFYDLYKVHFNFTHPVDVNFHQDMSNKVGWTKLDTTFIASGNERWLTIGNFLPDSLSDTSFVGGNPPQTGNSLWDYSNLNIDDVSVELYDETKIKEDGYAFGINIYPNPNNGTFTVNIANNEPAKIEIVDVIGQIVLRETCANKKVINTENSLLSGVYLCKIIQNNQVVYQTKLIIKR